MVSDEEHYAPVKGQHRLAAKQRERLACCVLDPAGFPADVQRHGKVRGQPCHAQRLLLAGGGAVWGAGCFHGLAEGGEKVTAVGLGCTVTRGKAAAQHILRVNHKVEERGGNTGSKNVRMNS